ncbi:MAG TPA: hypothetical protein VF020_01325 [Chthoniobacterales bacterium]
MSVPNVTLVKAHSVLLKECSDFFLEHHFPVVDLLIDDIGGDGIFA